MGKTRTRLAAVDEYVSLDTETTGLDVKWCELIEVAAIRYKDGKEAGCFSSLIRPSRLPLDPFIEELTGIRSSKLEDAPSASEVIPGLIDFIGDLPIVGHNVCFDARFISSCCADLGIAALDNVLIDTLRISRHVFRALGDRKLPSVAKACEGESGEPFDSSGSYHRARYDAAMASFCYESMKPLLIGLYGEDPESGYSKSRSKGSGKEIDFGDLAPTVGEIDESNPFYMQTVCFTGALHSMPRSEAAQRAVNLGAVPLKGVTKKLDYLVVGSFEFASSVKGDKSGKVKKAERYMLDGAPIQIVSEDFFMEYAAGAI